MNEIEDLYKILGLIGMIGAFWFGLSASIKSTINNALKPIEKKLDDVVSKELYEAEKKAFREEIRNDLVLKFKDVDNREKETNHKWEEAVKEHRAGKKRADELTTELIGLIKEVKNEKRKK